MPQLHRHTWLTHTVSYKTSNAIKRRKRKRLPAKDAKKMQLKSAHFAPIIIGPSLSGTDFLFNKTRWDLLSILLPSHAIAWAEAWVKKGTWLTHAFSVKLQMQVNRREQRNPRKERGIMQLRSADSIFSSPVTSTLGSVLETQFKK